MDQAADVLECYDLPFCWHDKRHRIMVGVSDVVLLYLEDGVQASMV